MFLARVIGSVVSTKKDEAMKGRKLVILRPLLVDEANPAQFRNGTNTVVAIDAMGAGLDEVVLFCQGSSARQAVTMASHADPLHVAEIVGYIRSTLAPHPELADLDVGIVCGSGLSGLSAAIEAPVAIPYSSIPHFPRSTVAGHGTELVFGRLGGKKVVAARGRFHFYEGHGTATLGILPRVFAARIGERSSRQLPGAVASLTPLSSLRNFMQLNQRDISQFRNSGYVIVKGLFSGRTLADLIRWTGEVEAWPEHIQAVTPEQVAKAAAAVFKPTASVTGVLLPDANAGPAVRRAVMPLPGSATKGVH
jgi:microcompartment protein CcmK/EutM